MNKKIKKLLIFTLVCLVIFILIFVGVIGFWLGSLSQKTKNELNFSQNHNITKVNEESDIISTVEKVSPAVVSIIITKDLPKIKKYYSSPFDENDSFDNFFKDKFFNFRIPEYRQNGTEEYEVGGGTGFIITSDGYIVTNKHVVADEEAEYTVIMNDENKYDAEVVARDPVTDFAVLKIKGKNFPVIKLGNSDDLKVGQTVIAIGNALGEFRNTVSVGVISGLSRSITAGSFNFGTEHLVGVIQTDASINHGNSGGPLLNLAGQVIGINTAIAQGAQNIGFAIPINEVKNNIESVKEYGKIVRPWLGVRYVTINKSIAQSNKLDVEHGALIIRGEERTDLAVIPGSPADKAGLVENDIILEVNGKKIDQNYPLIKAISKFKPGDEVNLKVLHKGEEKEVKIKLKELN